MAVGTLAIVLGLTVGIGEYIGTSDQQLDVALREAENVRMKQMQLAEEKNRLANEEQELNATTGSWRNFFQQGGFLSVKVHLPNAETIPSATLPSGALPADFPESTAGMIAETPMVFAVLIGPESLVNSHEPVALFAPGPDNVAATFEPDWQAFNSWSQDRRVQLFEKLEPMFQQGRIHAWLVKGKPPSNRSMQRESLSGMKTPGSFSADDAPPGPAMGRGPGGFASASPDIEGAGSTFDAGTGSAAGYGGVPGDGELWSGWQVDFQDAKTLTHKELIQLLRR